MEKMFDFLKKIYLKYKEIINYIIVGGFTTVVSIASYYLIQILINNYLVSTVLSWVCAVLFAYITNRIFVFETKGKKIIPELVKFVSYRLLSLLIELVSMYILVDFININDRISKIIVQFIVLVLNYLFSKIFVFKK